MDIAMRHSLTTRRVLVRGDGSTAHEGMFDLRDRRISEADDAPGLSRRFLLVARAWPGRSTASAPATSYTRDPRFLETAEACADFYIEHTPADGVPPWDYDAPPESRAQVDTSAAAIAASGLFQLAGLCADPVKGHVLRVDGAADRAPPLREVSGPVRSGVGRNPARAASITSTRIWA